MQKTSTCKRACLLLALLSLFSPLHAQDSGIGMIWIPDIRQMTQQGLAALPTEVRHIREQQQRLARESNAVIGIIERPGQSSTVIHKLPDFLANKAITNRDDATALIHALLPYYGFTDTESLPLEAVSESLTSINYWFRQHIDGTPTPETLFIEVDKRSSQRWRFSQLRIYIDRGQPPRPPTSRTSQLNEPIDTPFTDYAQDSGIGTIWIPDIRLMTQHDLTALPAEIRHIREEQRRLARESNALLEIIESPGRSSTIIHDAPDFLYSKIISNEDDAAELIHDLYPYYGFGDTESLQLMSAQELFPGTVYHFKQHIDGIPTPRYLRISVDVTGQIQSFTGEGIDIDRDYPPVPQLSEWAAVEAALDWAAEVEAAMMASGAGFVYRLDGNDIYTKVDHYRSWGGYDKLELEWSVYIPFWNQEDGAPTHEEFLVRPDGYVHKAEITLH